MPVTNTGYRRNHLTFLLLALAVLLGFSSLVQAQSSATRTERFGFRHVGPGAVADSNATFAIGMSLDGNTTFVDNARISDNISITGLVRPEPGHVGQIADVFVVDRFNITEFTMRVPGGDYIPWNGNVSALVPFLDDVVLTDSHLVELYAGLLSRAGDHRMFLGYRPADGVLRYNIIGHPLNITTQSAREQAEEFFPEKISANIVQTACIACHRSGGSGQGTLHTFVFPSNPNHLSINFSQFENLVTARGREYVLSKVQGGLGHGGGAQLSSASQEYRDLDAFLQLLEQL